MDIITSEDREIVADVRKAAAALDAAANAHTAAMEALLEKAGYARLRGIETLEGAMFAAGGYRLRSDWEARIVAVKTVSMPVEG